MNNKTEGEECEENAKTDEVIPGYKSIDDFTKEGFKTVLETTRNFNALPSEKNWAFFNTNDNFNKLMTEQGDRVMGLINNVMRKYGIDENIKHRDFEEKIELIIDTNDTILEKVANHIDEINGVRKVSTEPVLIQTVSAQLPINGSWNKINKATFSINSPINTEVIDRRDVTSIHLLTAKNILRPQKFFKDKINNSTKYPWEPRITEKPNSIKPLALYLEETEFGEMFCHPYEIELEKFTPTDDQLKLQNPVLPKPVDDTPLYEINTVDQLNKLLDDLYKCKEFAVDLEHHSYRSFMGITCLMQISTSDADYIIDTLALRDKLHILNEVFTKPSIVKIFHGADSDVQWLQRDLSIYVVNMFDTHQAAKQLGYSGLSLSYLLNKFCNLLPNKQFQLADWRIRPLPDKLKSYAREDTHYLIYIYHILKRELLKLSNNNDNILRSVINNSTEICKKRYIKPMLTEETHINFYRKCKRMFDNRQMYALKHLYCWRDTIAREEDESTGYVLPNHMLLQIAETLPREMQGILACCNPIPPLVRSNLLEIHNIVLRAREQPLQKPIMHEENRSRGSTQQLVTLNVNNPLYCPHDLTKSHEFRDDLPTLLGGQIKNILKNECPLEKVTSKLSALNDLNDKLKNIALEKREKLKFLGPYERYKLVKPYIQAEEEKAKSIAGSSNIREDKIALLHEHFDQTVTTNIDEEAEDISIPDRIKMLQQHVSEQVAVNNEDKSLLAMGGSKKRKRIRDASDDRMEPPRKFDNCYNNFAMGLQNTVPNPHSKEYNQYYYNKRKREAKTEWHTDVTKCIKIDNVGQKKFNNGNKNKQKNWKRRQNPSIKQNPQHSNQSRPFDYNSVDYRQFQGGASGVQANKRNVKSNFKGKGKKKNYGNKTNNRSSTFGTNIKRGKQS